MITVSDAITPAFHATMRADNAFITGTLFTLYPAVNVFNYGGVTFNQTTLSLGDLTINAARSMKITFIANKFLEAWSGAVLAKILILVAVILFIQKRPRGLFALKGRAAEA